MDFENSSSYFGVELKTGSKCYLRATGQKSVTLLLHRVKHENLYRDSLQLHEIEFFPYKISLQSKN